jgi:hypothetical protein
MLHHELPGLVVARDLADPRPKKKAGQQASRHQQHAAVARFVHRPNSLARVLSV